MVRVNAILIAPDSSGAFITEIHVATIEDSKSRLQFRGPAIFDIKVREHIEAVLLPLVDKILTELKLPLISYDISAVNAGIAASQDASIHISGFSADLPITLGLLGAALDVPVKDSIYTTGHIASLNGEIRPIRGLELKAKAVAALDKRNSHFLYPLPDSSLGYSAAIETELREMRGRIRAHPISRLIEAVPYSFDQIDLLLAALHLDYFERKVDSPVSKLLACNSQYFFEAIESLLSQFDAEKIQALLLAWIGFYKMKRRYPSGSGAQLNSMLLSMPQAVRRLRTEFPLIPRKQVMRLASLLKEGDFEDFDLFGRAIEGKIEPPKPAGTFSLEANDPSAVTTLDLILDEVCEENIQRKIVSSLDKAYACYHLSEYHDFDENITSFYLHLLRYLGEVQSATHKQIAPDAYALLGRAYRHSGGTTAAITETERKGIGGMHGVLDQMFQTIRTERIENYIQYVFTRAIDPMDYTSKLELTKAFIQRFRHALPEAVVSEPPERYAQKWEVLIRHWLDAQSHLSRRLQSL